MKASLTSLLLTLQRPGSPQAVMKLFAASNLPKQPECLRYLSRPHYRTIGQRTVTFAGDGRVFLWAHSRIPGFADYQHPPPGMGYVDVPDVLALRRGFAQIDCPQPAGPWTAGAAMDEVWISQHAARVRRFDLARLNLLNTVQLGAGEKFVENGYTTGWRTVGIWWKHGTLAGEGLILCPPPRSKAVPALKPKRKKPK